jgi:CDP-diacylglycerol--glycerol-3-phosphate 3-phosphatidyltransferase
VFDILSDRACSTICIGALLVIRPEFAPALTVYFLQFMVVDALLTMSFLHWPWLKSPNYFYQVDRLIYRLNWSQPAKAANTSLLLAVLLVSYWAHWPFWIALVLALVQLVLKLWSAVRLLHLTTAQGARPAGPAQPDGKGVIRAALVAAGPSRPARPAGGPGAA